MPLLALHAVSKSFGALKVTDDITLSVDPGQTLGILGPNGAGKTTLFNLISGDLRCDAGRVEEFLRLQVLPVVLDQFLVAGGQIRLGLAQIVDQLPRGLGFAIVFIRHFSAVPCSGFHFRPLGRKAR